MLQIHGNSSSVCQVFIVFFFAGLHLQQRKVSSLHVIIHPAIYTSLKLPTAHVGQRCFLVYGNGRSKRFCCLGRGLYSVYVFELK